MREVKFTIFMCRTFERRLLAGENKLGQKWAPIDRETRSAKLSIGSFAKLKRLTHPAALCGKICWTALARKAQSR